MSIYSRLEALEQERQFREDIKRRYLAAIDKQTAGLTPDELEQWAADFVRSGAAALVKAGERSPDEAQALAEGIAAEALEWAKRRWAADHRATGQGGILQAE